MKDLVEKYGSIEEQIDTLFSILIYEKDIDTIIKIFEDQLEKAKKISNPSKKTKVNNRLFAFIKYLNDNFKEGSIVNSIFLINDKIIEYELKKEEIKIAKEYNIKNPFIKCETKFCVQYFYDFLYDFNFIYTIRLNKSDLSYSELNNSKEKEIETVKISGENKILEIVEKIRLVHNYKDLIIIYGVSPYLSKIDGIKNILIHRELVGKDDLYALYEKEEMKKNLYELDKRLSDLTNEKTNTDLYVFGKLKFEIKEAIESYALKELYIDEKKIDNLKKFVDNSCFNFKIIKIKSLEEGDSGYRFIKDYNGIMGLRYY